MRSFRATVLVGLAVLVVATCVPTRATLSSAEQTLVRDRGEAAADAVRPAPPAGARERAADAFKTPPAAGGATSPSRPPRGPASQTPSNGVAPQPPANQQVVARPPANEQVVPQPPADRQGVPQPPAQPVVFRKVETLRPQLRVYGVESASAAEQIRDVDGVRFATDFEIGAVTVNGREITVAGVEPKQFRVVTPQITADAVGVWQRITEGDAAFTHETGHRLRAELGGNVRAGSTGFPLRVGAYASNGVPPVADAIVSDATARQLGLQGRRDVLVSLAEGVDAQRAAASIGQITASDIDVLAEPQTHRAFISGADAQQEFEPFSYIDNRDGMIQIDPGWVSRNIVRRQVAVLNGEVLCHRLMVDQLAGALAEVEASGLSHLIDPGDYGGCWVPRHIDFDPNDPISMHAWGLAVDFNVSTNQLGQTPTMDPRVVEIFDRWGFVWGGRWSRPDGMHFELGALLRSPRG